VADTANGCYLALCERTFAIVPYRLRNLCALQQLYGWAKKSGLRKGVAGTAGGEWVLAVRCVEGGF